MALRFFGAGGVFLFLTSVLNMGDASDVRIVAEESAKLMGVLSFLLGFLAALAGTLDEVQRALKAAPSSGAHVPESKWVGFE